MDTKHRQLFESYFQQQVERENAFSLGDKVRLVDRLYQDASENGLVPIAPGQVARVPAQSPRVQAILAGKEIALGGKTIQGQATLQQKMATLPPVQKLLILFLVFTVPGIGLWGFGRYQDSTALAFTETPTITATQTVTPTRTPRPENALATPTPYALVLDNAAVPKQPHDPVSISFANVAFTLGVAQLDEGAWQPAVAEWLPGTELRRVVAVPYTLEVGNAVATLTYGSEITLRLLSGEVVVYRLVDIQRMQRHAIEVLNALAPSLVMILHGERAGQRWLLLAEAPQRIGLPTFTPTTTSPPTMTATPTPEGTLTPTVPFDGTGSPTILPSPTPTSSPTATPTPTASPTPALAFTPPLPVTEIYTDTQIVINEAAGLQLTISNCAKVVQIGRNEGDFVVCEVTLTALHDGVEYSNDTLAISELSQVQQIPGWWPPPLSVVGSIGNGQLSQAADSVSGKVAGTIAKKQSEPVLLWEQAGFRFVIPLESLLDE
ncbi:MAG: hypothetical protein HUU38_28930 [Anaerolineales bacterium]|nr:hypothetical protein [Anaerolineales bacterium]